MSGGVVLSLSILSAGARLTDTACNGKLFYGSTALILHEESFASYGLAALLRERRFSSVALSLDQAVADSIQGESGPDFCFCGNLDDCSSAFLQVLRARFQRTRIILFDVDIADDAEVAEYECASHQMGFDDLLPAYSSKTRLVDGLRQIMARCVQNKPQSTLN